jgi:hypothetical protein
VCPICLAQLGGLWTPAPTLGTPSLQSILNAEMDTKTMEKRGLWTPSPTQCPIRA